MSKNVFNFFLGILFLFHSIIFSETILVPSQYSTIQDAINASVDGDSISVSNGTYFENLDFQGKNIKVVGESSETTIIDGSQGISITEFINGGFEQGMEMWQMYPSWDSHQIAHTGDQIYNSQETFQAYEGNSP